MLKNGNLLLAIASAFAALVVLASAASAQSNSANSFFGAGGSGGADAGGTQTTNPYADPSVPKGDFTADEKRMQKKYVESISHARGLISKGEKMIQDGTKRGEDKMAKKGKVLKMIGEKTLAELQANNPLGDLLADKKADTAKTQVAGTGNTGVDQ
jgi:hypothetical protein